MRDAEAEKYIRSKVLEAVWVSADPKVRLIRTLLVVEALALGFLLTVFGVQWIMALFVVASVFALGAWFIPIWILEKLADGVVDDSCDISRHDQINKQLANWGERFSSRVSVSFWVLAVHPLLVPLLLWKGFTLFLTAIQYVLEIYTGRK